jgi:dephospho-CoA kinase
MCNPILNHAQKQIKIRVSPGIKKIMRTICITGGIACGKSSVAGILVKLGIPVIEADAVCHDLLEKNAAVIRRITAVFGRRVLKRSGAVDRRALGRIVFAGEKMRKKLNAIVHPAARRQIRAWLKSGKIRRAALAAAVVPLVYEARWHRDWDRVVCVAAPLTMQVARLRKKGLSGKEAAARIAAQMPVSEKMERADHVIFNSGTLAGLGAQTFLLFRKI